MRVDELIREERLILAWLRDVTAAKQARLAEIRAELRRRSAAAGGMPVAPDSDGKR